MSKATRVKAAKLAAQCVAGQFISGEISAQKLFSLCVFFESWIELGGNETEKRMRLLRQRKVKNLKVVAGGKL
jgi:hypothetical protein